MMEEQKKEYIAPELTVVEMQRQALLQELSCDSESPCIELSLAPTSNDHLA